MENAVFIFNWVDAIPKTFLAVFGKGGIISSGFQYFSSEVSGIFDALGAKYAEFLAKFSAGAKIIAETGKTLLGDKAKAVSGLASGMEEAAMIMLKPYAWAFSKEAQSMIPNLGRIAGVFGIGGGLQKGEQTDLNKGLQKGLQTIWEGITHSSENFWKTEFGQLVQKAFSGVISDEAMKRAAESIENNRLARQAQINIQSKADKEHPLGYAIELNARSSILGMQLAALPEMKTSDEMTHQLLSDINGNLKIGNVAVAG